jgi:sugar O-acyltransferase (sialic acid O-acetyltransferase NeuD family)
MQKDADLFVFGAGGHAKVVLDMVDKYNGFGGVYLADENPALKGCQVLGRPVIGGRDDLLRLRTEMSSPSAIVAIGDNCDRAAVARWLVDHGFLLVSAVHPSAQIGQDVTIGRNTVIMAGVIVNPGSRIGSNVILNTASSVDHDCTIEDDVHVAPGCRLCGEVSIGARSFVGAGTVIVCGLTVGADVTIGAGSLVLSDIPDGAKAYGSPCKVTT